MKNFTGWAVASVAAALLGGCTTEVTAGADGGTGTTSSTTGAGGAGSTTTSTTTTTTGSGGSTGGSSDDGGTCAPSAMPTACETCVFSNCMTEICDCQANTDCKAALPDYFTCLAALNGGDMESCAGDFTVAAGNNGAGKANALGSCINDAAACQNSCSGKDGG